MASAATQQQVLRAADGWLRPLVHVLLRCGVSYKDFVEQVRRVYVEVAASRFGRRGRPTNVSRIALLTGLARRDVRRVRELHEAADAPVEAPPSGFVSRGSLLLSAWHQQPQFLDAQGAPALLTIDGPAPSFALLVREVGGGDVPASTLLKELRNAGAVEQLADGRLRALKRNFIPQSLDPNLVRLWGSVVTDIARTYEHNLMRPRGEPARFERAAVDDCIDPAAIPEFRAFLDREGQQFLERVDAWLNEHRLPPEQGGRVHGIRLGAGVYHVQD